MRDSKRLRDHVQSNAVAYVALFVALGGTGAWAADKITSADIAKNAVRSKHIKKKAVKTPKIADRAVTADKLAANATSRFAYIRDDGPLNAANVQYGRGVPAVDDPIGDNAYKLTFDRSIVNCVVLAQPGYGNPAGSANVEESAFGTISMEENDPREVDVFFEMAGGGTTDTAFLVTATC
jgi:hypothetical protein